MKKLREEIGLNKPDLDLAHDIAGQAIQDNPDLTNGDSELTFGHVYISAILAIKAVREATSTAKSFVLKDMNEEGWWD